MSQPITIEQFENLLAKFIGTAEAREAISMYFSNRVRNRNGDISEFELPALKNYIETTLAGSVGSAAAGAIVESYLSGMGSRMEPVFDVFSTVRASRDESRETLYVRLRASEIMNRTLDLQIIMDDLLDLLVKELKLDLAVIYLTNNRTELSVRSCRAKNENHMTKYGHLTDPDSYLREVYVTNKVYFVNDTAHIINPEIRDIMERENIKSLAHIPIARTGEPPFGILSVFSKSITGLFTVQFLNFLASLSGQLAQAVKIVSEMDAKERALLENAKVTRELEIARQIQMSLLPPSPPDAKGVIFASLCLPADQIGGDYYDFFNEDGNSVGIVIADVSGHSVGAALMMVEVRSFLRAQLHSAGNAGEILSILNSILHEDLCRTEFLISMFYAQYNTDNRHLSYANAGHNPPILLRWGRDEFQELDAEGMIFGVLKNVSFEERSLELQDGDLIFFYTDGITETQNGNGEFFGTERLCKIIINHRSGHPQQIIDAVMKEIMGFAGSPSLQDDVSIIVLKLGQNDNR